MTAFLHPAGADGVRVGAFLAHARRVLALLDPVFAQLAHDVDRGRSPGDEDTPAMELAALEHMVATSGHGGSPRSRTTSATARTSRAASPCPRCAGSVHTALISVQPGGRIRSPAIATSAPPRRMPR